MIVVLSLLVMCIHTSLTQLIGVEQVLTVGFRPEANGIVERTNAEGKRHLQVIVNRTKSEEVISRSTVGPKNSEFVSPFFYEMERPVQGQESSGNIYDCTNRTGKLVQVAFIHVHQEWIPYQSCSSSSFRTGRRYMLVGT